MITKRFKKSIRKHYQTIEDLGMVGTIIMFVPFLFAIFKFYEWYPFSLICTILFLFCFLLLALASENLLWVLVKDGDVE